MFMCLKMFRWDHSICVQNVMHSLHFAVSTWFVVVVFTIRAPKSVFVLRSESFCLFFVFVFEGIGRYAACKAVRL